MQTQKIARCALFTCAALVLSLVESFLPVAAVPVPGIKLGLANIVILFALYRLDLPSAWVILAAKCILSAVFGGGVTAFAFSLCGGALALLVMACLKRLDGRGLSVYGVSVAGAAAHGVGQILAAMLLMRTTVVIGYLPLLLAAGIVTGALTGAIASLLFRRFPEAV